MAHSEDGFAAAFYLMASILVFSSLPLIPTLGPRPPPTVGSDTAGPHAGFSSSRCGLTPLEACLVACSAACLLAYVGSEVGYGGFIFTFAVTELDMPKAAARGLNSLYWAGLAAGRLLAIPMATRLPPQTILTGALVGALAASALLPLLPHGSPTLDDSSYNSTNAGTGQTLGDSAETGQIREAGGEKLAWVVTAVLGLCHAPIFPTVITHAERYMRVSGRVASTFVVSAAVGEAVLPFSIAVAYSADHGSFPRIIFAACLAQLAAYSGTRIAAVRMKGTRVSEMAKAGDGMAPSASVGVSMSGTA